ncbi:MAG: NAD(P)-binding domain-containing protein [Cytophagaceae bacterium]|jgi:D-lactate dehydrogenase|nr:NAD(P)-binding domain-containing protein [Cytophagaceae bacterium]
MKLVVYSVKEYELPFLQQALPPTWPIIWKEEALQEHTADFSEGAEGVSVFTNDDLSDAMLLRLQSAGVRHIAIRAAGFDHIHLEKAQELGIHVANVPNYSPYAIAEHALALLLMLNRKLHLTIQRTAHYDFRLNGLTGMDFHGKTAAIIGTGNIGAILARILHGFGCALLGYDLAKNKTLVEELGMRYTSLEEICEKSDLISIHLPLNAQTKGMFDASFFSSLKKNALVVNTGRGPILQTEAALDALDKGLLAGLALDVYEKEKGVFFYDRSQQRPIDPILDRLLQHPNVVLSPHQAFLTQEALQNIADATASSFIHWSQGKPSDTQLV